MSSAPKYPLAQANKILSSQDTGPTCAMLVPDGLPSHSDSCQVSPDEYLPGTCSSCNCPLILNPDKPAILTNTICRDCIALKTSIPSERPKCQLCYSIVHASEATSPRKGFHCLQCAPRLRPGQKIDPADLPLFHYCAQCRCRMTQTTANPLLKQGRICAACVKGQQIEREEEDPLGTFQCCRVCNCYVDPIKASGSKFEGTGICILCYGIEEEKDATSIATKPPPHNSSDCLPLWLKITKIPRERYTCPIL